MKSGNWKIVPALSALVLATMFAPYAHAGCGLYSPVPHAASWQPQIASPRLVLAALTIDEDAAAPHEPSIVGTWKEKWISEGSSSGSRTAPSLTLATLSGTVTALRSMSPACVLP